MLTTLILLTGSLVPSMTELPQPILADDKAYQQAAGSEREMEGQLRINPGDGRLGLPQRYHSFRLISVEDGKPVSRPVFASGKEPWLAAYVGHRVRLVGKVVETEASGKKIEEFWPARILAVTNEASDTIAQVEILGRTNNWTPNTSRTQVQAQVHVIRNGADLAKLMGYGGPGAESTAASMLARALRVSEIDWKKHMIIAVSGGVRPNGNARVEIGRLTLLESGMEVSWKLTNAIGVGGVSPTEAVLVPRYDGEVRFYQEGVKQPLVVPATGTSEKDAKAGPSGDKQPAGPVKPG